MKIKKLSALLVSAALCAGMAAPAFAFEGEAAPVEQPVLPEVMEDVVTVAQTMLSTSGRCIRSFRMPNCFLVDADTRYCHCCGRIGRSAMFHLAYCSP
jgi:hypothetical protein